MGPVLRRSGWRCERSRGATSRRSTIDYRAASTLREHERTDRQSVAWNARRRSPPASTKTPPLGGRRHSRPCRCCRRWAGDTGCLRPFAPPRRVARPGAAASVPGPLSSERSRRRSWIRPRPSKPVGRSGVGAPDLPRVSTVTHQPRGTIAAGAELARTQALVGAPSPSRDSRAPAHRPTARADADGHLAQQRNASSKEDRADPRKRRKPLTMMVRGSLVLQR